MTFIISSIKRYFRHRGVKKYLNEWLGLPVEYKGFPNFTIKRTYTIDKLFIDIYWHIKPNDIDSESKDYIYKRCRWRDVRSAIHYVEKHQLHHSLEKLEKLERESQQD